MSFFSKKYFGIDIYDNSIKIMELSGNSISANLATYSSLDLQPDIVKNGQVINQNLLTQAIKQALSNAKPKKISNVNCIFALPESKLILTHIRIPKSTDPKNFSKTILEKVQETIPFQAKDLYFDYKIVLTYKDYYEILFTGVQKGILDEFITSLQQAGLKVSIVDFESACLIRSLIANCNMNDAYAIIDIGGRTTIATIYDFCNIRFSDNMPIAGNEFTQAIISKWNLSFQEAEEFKKTYGLDPMVEEGKVMLVLQEPMQELINSIKKDINFYQGKTGRKISKIILCGGSSDMPKIVDYFYKNLNIKTELGNPFLKIKTNEQISSKIDYTTVAGLALRGLEKKPIESGINLLKNIK
ncbi:MAG: type IV pilus assembly protein PilM [Patescibacteria group bacterium]|jgi:type IV pilus assembly protein PilM